MSTLLRVLMGQQVGGEKPNLAVVTESTVSTDALNGKTFTHAGVTAGLKKDITYHVTFDLEMNFTESSGAGKIQLGNYVPWGYNGRFFSENVSDELQTITRHIDMDVRTIGAFNSRDDGLMIWVVENKKGTLHISNLVITEV